MLIAAYDRRGRRIVFDEQNWQTLKSAALFGWIFIIITIMLSDVSFYFYENVGKETFNEAQHLAVLIIAIYSPAFYLLVQRIRGNYG